jgi:hypothetical protein
MHFHICQLRPWILIELHAQWHQSYLKHFNRGIQLLAYNKFEMKTSHVCLVETLRVRTRVFQLPTPSEPEQEVKYNSDLDSSPIDVMPWVWVLPFTLSLFMDKLKTKFPIYKKKDRKVDRKNERKEKKN